MANEKRLIDANALKWKMCQVRLYVASLRYGKTIISKLFESYRKAVFEEIDNAPTVDAVEVVHGRWEDGICTMCGYPIPTDSKCDFIDEDDCLFCYHCGAKMKGENEDVNLR